MTLTNWVPPRSPIYSKAPEASHAFVARHPSAGVASLWELVIKQALGRPHFRVEPALLRRALLLITAYKQLAA